MTSCFVARIFNPGERFGKPFYEVDVPRPLKSLVLKHDVSHELPDLAFHE